MTYRLEPVVASRGPAFAETYGALAAEFAPKGEIERREVVARWLDAPAARPGEPLQRTYHLLAARDEHGALAGARDCHVVLDVPGAVAVVYLAHALVLPPYRRSGLGALLRGAPIELAREALRAAGVDPAAADVLLAAEMEPAVLDDRATLVRLVAYGREGYAAVSPAALPYCQPDMRDLDAPGAAPARPLPLLAVVRWLGHEGATALPRRLARGYLRHLYAVFATHVRADHLDALATRTLAALDAYPADAVPLLPLARDPDDLAALRPLTRAAVLPYFPEELR